MAIINLRKYYYPTYKKDTFIEVSDEVAEALLLMLRAENNYNQKRLYHKAYFSLDCEDGIENDALVWMQPSPEELFIQAEEQAHAELFIRRLEQALNCLTPIQANRVYAHFFLGKRYIEIARDEGVSSSVIGRSIIGAVDRLRRYFKQQKWEDFYL